jgi:gas vesicle protein
MDKGKALPGVLAGSAPGILFAPDKGEHTRVNISRKGEDLANEINDKPDKKSEQVIGTILSKSGRTKLEAGDEESN